MIPAPNYFSNSHNPKIKPKWLNSPTATIRLPKSFHGIAWDICQAIDQEFVSEEQVRQWLLAQLPSQEGDS